MVPQGEKWGVGQDKMLHKVAHFRYQWCWMLSLSDYQKYLFQEHEKNFYSKHIERL